MPWRIHGLHCFEIEYPRIRPENKTHREKHMITILLSWFIGIDFKVAAELLRFRGREKESNEESKVEKTI